MNQQLWSEAFERIKHEVEDGIREADNPDCWPYSHDAVCRPCRNASTLLEATEVYRRAARRRHDCRV